MDESLPELAERLARAKDLDEWEVEQCASVALQVAKKAMERMAKIADSTIGVSREDRREIVAAIRAEIVKLEGR